MKSNAVQLLETQIKFNFDVANKNMDGISNEEAMIFPNGEANCMNWILGHFIYIRNSLIQILGGNPVWEKGKYDFYQRYAKPWEHKDEFPSFEELKSALKSSQDELLEALENTEDFKSENIEDLAGLSLHEIYHSGQFGYLRRILGKENAV